ncbi:MULTISPECIES: hypothetical protein [unclassified Moorena]|uniref:hypothetical protein n=1 Tax=unclassified Moorena TaxID=2683338 RepID=UPI0013C02358|nr:MULTISPECIES: hypothetical protein [unclassified Moorena]NES43498.1 hypothetical protein [Moorena sp. SIO2C4]NET64388.1 hypothetical protein [Moorena sp. SIO1G6]
MITEIAGNCKELPGIALKKYFYFLPIGEAAPKAIAFVIDMQVTLRDRISITSLLTIPVLPSLN